MTSGAVAIMVAAFLSLLGVVIAQLMVKRSNQQTAEIASETDEVKNLLEGNDRLVKSYAERLRAEEERCDRLEGYLRDTQAVAQAAAHDAQMARGEIEVVRRQARDHTAALVRLLRALASREIDAAEALARLDAMPWLGL